MNGASVPVPARVTRRSAIGGTVAGVSAGAVFTAACGAGQAGPAAKEVAPATITDLSPNNQQRLQRHRQAFDAFTAEHPNVKVEINPLPEGQTWDTAMVVRHQAGDPADVMEFVTYWHHLLPLGVPVDLAPLMKRAKIETSRFLPEPVANFTVADKLYAMPVSLSVDGFGYNVDLLERAGLAPPPANPEDKSWTMEKFFEYTQKLTKQGDQWGFGGRHSGGGGFYHEATFFGMGVWDEKTRKLTIDTPEFRKGLEFWRDLDLRYHFQPTTQEARQLISGDVFLSGKIGIQNEYVGSTPSFRWGLASLPYSGPGKNVAGRIGLHSLAMGRGKQQDAAWTLLDWYAQTANGGWYAWAQGQAVSPLVDEKASERPLKEWREVYNVDPKALLLQAKYSKRARWGISTLANSDQMDKDIQAAFTKFRAGQISTDELVREATRLASAALAATPAK
jgi:multiple sugar transport system substrate-binding protein